MLSGALELLLRISMVLLLANAFGLGFLSICIAEVSAWLGAAVLLCATYYFPHGAGRKRVCIERINILWQKRNGFRT